MSPEERKIRNNLASKKWRKNHPEIRKATVKKYEENNRGKRVEYLKNYRIQNRTKINAYKVKRRQESIEYKISCYLRTRVYQALQRKKSSGSAIKDLGCSLEQLKQYLESNFHPGMTWENHKPDGWHIDHITPLASFDLTNREEFVKACHYTNLQPLWWNENLSKGKRI
jgi:hypothetical protein